MFQRNTQKFQNRSELERSAGGTLAHQVSSVAAFEPENDTTQPAYQKVSL